ncbi:MAG: SDR family oxidoreductase [Chloroflexota bacterium]
MQISTQSQQNHRNILIFGATGSIGRQLVDQALEQGHMVTAFVRDPQKLAVNHQNLNIVKGNVLQANSVSQAMGGQDVVLTALGSSPWKNTNVRAEGIKHIVNAMEKCGLQRLISLSTLGTGNSWHIIPLKYKILFSTILRKAFVSHEHQETTIKQSKLDWTIVRPGAFEDSDQTGEYRHGFPLTDKTIKATISRADVADFMLKQLNDDTYLRQSPGLSY